MHEPPRGPNGRCSRPAVCLGDLIEGDPLGDARPDGIGAPPRQIDIDQVSDEEIQDIVITANLTPRKCLSFRTPFQAILKELGKDVQIRFA